MGSNFKGKKDSSVHIRAAQWDGQLTLEAVPSGLVVIFKDRSLLEE